MRICLEKWAKINVKLNDESIQKARQVEIVLLWEMAKPFSMSTLFNNKLSRKEKKHRPRRMIPALPSTNGSLQIETRRKIKRVTNTIQSSFFGMDSILQMDFTFNFSLWFFFSLFFSFGSECKYSKRFKNEIIL